MDVLCVKKVPMPGYPELAMGAVAPMGERFTNRRIASVLSTAEIEAAYDAATAEARAMDERLRHGLPLERRRPDRRDHRRRRRHRCIGARGARGHAQRDGAADRDRTARSPPAVGRALARECDRLVTLRAPQRFRAVSQFYEEFPQVTEERVRELLAAHLPAMELT